MISCIEPVPSHDDYDIETLSPKFADEAAEPGADPFTVAGADATSTTDSDATAAGSADVVVGEADRLRGINRSRLFHLLRRGIGHRDFRHVEIVHLAAAASAAAGLEVDHDQFAAALFMDGDNQEQQQTDMKKDR